MSWTSWRSGKASPCKPSAAFCFHLQLNVPVLPIPRRVAVVGNVDAGKSTLLGVLTHGELDNGRGFARQKLFRHKHEMESGRTSSVGNDILGFDQEGQVDLGVVSVGRQWCCLMRLFSMFGCESL